MLVKTVLLIVVFLNIVEASGWDIGPQRLDDLIKEKLSSDVEKLFLNEIELYLKELRGAKYSNHKILLAARRPNIEKFLGAPFHYELIVQSESKLVIPNVSFIFHY